MEEIDVVAFGGDVELVVFAEELGGAFPEEAGFLFCGLLENGLKDLSRANQYMPYE